MKMKKIPVVYLVDEYIKETDYSFILAQFVKVLKLGTKLKKVLPVGHGSYVN